MKKNKIIRVLTFLFLVPGLFSCSRHRDMEISVRDSDDHYRFFAVYDKNKTSAVYHYLNEELQPNKLFSSTQGHVKAEFGLADHTKISLEAESGELTIELDKIENSTDSYLRIKRMCMNVKKLIQEK